MSEGRLSAGEPGRGRRAVERREQILDAASACFAREGFHGASIAQISKLSGMSTGHIYHFFENKEAIVTGIVERMARRWLSLLQPYGADADFAVAVAERAKVALRERTALDFVGLWLEVLAEAARNGLVARAVHAADRSIRIAVAEQIRFIREARGVRNETSVDAIVEVALALYEGMSIRAVVNDHFDAQAIEAVLLTATRAVLEA